MRRHPVSDGLSKVELILPRFGATFIGWSGCSLCLFFQGVCDLTLVIRFVARLIFRCTLSQHRVLMRLKLSKCFSEIFRVDARPMHQLGTLTICIFLRLTRIVLQRCHPRRTREHARSTGNIPHRNLPECYQAGSLKKTLE